MIQPGGIGPPHSMLGFSQFKPHQTTMETYLTPDEILQLVTTGVCKLSDDLMLRMAPKVSESYEDSDWYNDPNCTMSRHHY
jgi:hypothetical protein